MHGVNLPTVAKFMGHSDIETTMIYAHLVPEHFAKITIKLSFSKPIIQQRQLDLVHPSMDIAMASRFGTYMIPDRQDQRCLAPLHRFHPRRTAP